MYVRLFSWAAVILWMLLIFCFSHQAGSDSSNVSQGVTEIFLKTLQLINPNVDIEIEDLTFFIRKGAHFTVYFVLGFLVMNALRRSSVESRKAMALAFAISVLYAISDETHQLFIPGRSGEIRDVGIDSTGAIVGILAYLTVQHRWRRRSGTWGRGPWGQEPRPK
ncbi:VanZ like family protein [Oceanobacillus limi]|uniref:VanZ like family protein n=1 Tax=Oceanobacillus limi TaxID=930131 RepID=A0A1I0ACR1_9BACI|nr:VanZ family protein [Oceanobacillus limi]SES91481.1 VanZ like family protein [Oceanobacillus limi]